MIELFNCDYKDLIEKEYFKDKNICVVTDPPYNIGYKYNTYKDNLDEIEYLDIFKELYDKIGNRLVVMQYPQMLYKISHHIDIIPNKVCTWVYNSNLPKQHRDIAFFNVNPIFSQIKQPYKNINETKIKKRIEEGSEGANLYDWWYANQVKNCSSEKTSHPCQIPVEIMKNIVGIIPKEYTIFDPFCGTGTTGVACIELGYDFIGCEIDKEYYEIARGRLGLKDVFKIIK